MFTLWSNLFKFIAICIENYQYTDKLYRKLDKCGQHTLSFIGLILAVCQGVTTKV